jgi:hypothetical protein
VRFLCGVRLQPTRLPPQKRPSVTKNCRAAIFAAGCFRLAARMTALQFFRARHNFPFEKSWIIQAKQLSS